MKPGAGQGSPLRVAPPVQSDTGQNYYMSRAVGSYVSSAESWTSWTLHPRRWCSLPWSLRRCWPGVVRSSAWHKGGSGVELHRPGCDRCWPCCISSSACSEDRVSGALRARRACGVCFWRWRRRQERGRVRVDSVRDGVLLVSCVGDVFL